MYSTEVATFLFITSLVRLSIAASNWNLQDWSAIATCRAHCFKRYLTWPAFDEKCAENQSCFLCWQKCQAVYNRRPAKIIKTCSDGKCQDEACKMACEVYTSQSPRVESTGLWMFSSPAAVSVKSDQVLQLTWHRPVPVTEPIPEDAAQTPVVYVFFIKTDEKPSWTKISMTTNQRTVLDGDHKNISGLDFLLLAVTVNGIVGRSSSSYPDGAEPHASALSASVPVQSSKPGLPLVWYHDTDYYFYEEPEQVDVENDFLSLFGPPPAATTTLRPATASSVPKEQSSPASQNPPLQDTLQTATSQFIQSISGAVNSGPSRKDLFVAVAVSSVLSFIVTLLVTVLLLFCRSRYTRKADAVSRRAIHELAIRLSQTRAPLLLDNRLYSPSDKAAPRFISATTTALPPIPHEYISMEGPNEYTLPNTPAHSLDTLADQLPGRQQPAPHTFLHYMPSVDVSCTFPRDATENFLSPPTGYLQPVHPVPLGFIPGPLMATTRRVLRQPKQQLTRNSSGVSQSVHHPLYSTIQPKVRMGTANLKQHYYQAPTPASYETLPDTRPQETLSEYDTALECDDMHEIGQLKTAV